MRDMDAATWLETSQALHEFGWRVTLVVADSAKLKNNNVEILCIPRPEIYLLRQIIFHLRVLKYLISKLAAIDIVLFHERSAPWILAVRLIRNLLQKRLPLLIMDSRSLPMSVPENETWKDKVRRFAFWIGIKLGNRYADGRLAITKRLAETLSIPPRKLLGIWPSGVDINHFSSARINRKWPLPDDPIHLIYHGSLNYERNLMHLCRAVSMASTRGMSFILTLVGEGTERVELEEFASNTNGVIQVCHRIPYEEIPESLSKAHVGVLPFPDEEKFRVSSPIKLFEYMALGLPILATHIDCHKDVIGDGKYVFWVEKADVDGLFASLRIVWQNKGALSIMGTQASIAAQAWTWKMSAEKLKNALERGISEHGEHSFLQVIEEETLK
jgi:glycosyltransferase involved in cell wall biosynthesis